MHVKMSKKCPQDAFYFYKLQFEKENEGKTIFDRGITDIEVAARASWKSMTLQQRDHYEDLAKRADPTRTNTTKVDKSVLADSSIDEENNKIVNEIVRRFVRNDTVQTDEFYFIAANIFCETDLNKCLPAEMALLKFTLRDGVIRTFHTYINPETIPMGYRFIAIELSETTHRLPLPPNAMGEKNFANIQHEIYKFIGLNAQECKRGFIPLFTLAENVRMIESICQDLLGGSTSNAATNRRFKVLSINKLLFDLKTSVGRNISGTHKMKSFNGSSQFESIDDATAQLDREKYKFLCQIACEYHDEKDCSKYCSLSDVKRWAYVFSENICFDLKIPLIENKHFPIGVETPQQPNCARKESKAINAFPAALRDRKFDLNANLDSHEVKLCANDKAETIPARGDRRQRTYFAEQNYTRRNNFGRRGRGIRRG